MRVKWGVRKKKCCDSKYWFQGLGFLNYKTFILRLIRERLITITISWIAFHSPLQQENTSLIKDKRIKKGSHVWDINTNWLKNLSVYGLWMINKNPSVLFTPTQTRIDLHSILTKDIQSNETN